MPNVCQLPKSRSRWAQVSESQFAKALRKTHYLELSNSAKKSPARLQNLYSSVRFRSPPPKSQFTQQHTGTTDIRHFRLSHSWVTSKGLLRKLGYTDPLHMTETLMKSWAIGKATRDNISSRSKKPLFTDPITTPIANISEMNYSNAPC